MYILYWYFIRWVLFNKYNLYFCDSLYVVRIIVFCYIFLFFIVKSEFFLNFYILVVVFCKFKNNEIGVNVMFLKRMLGYDYYFICI